MNDHRYQSHQNHRWKPTLVLSVFYDPLTGYFWTPSKLGYKRADNVVGRTTAINNHSAPRLAWQAHTAKPLSVFHRINRLQGDSLAISNLSCTHLKGTAPAILGRNL